MALNENQKKIILGLGIFFLLGVFVFMVQIEQSLTELGNLEPTVTEPVAVEPEPATPKEPQFIEKKIFGYSSLSKPIEGYQIGFGENTLLLHASLHGDEVGTTDLLNMLVEEVRTNPALVATTTKLVVIPIVNPDGYYDRTDKLNANLVNLNLNFGTTGWQKYGPEGTYAGPEAFSEIESRILRQVAEDYKPSLMIAFHSEGALVSPEKGRDSVALAKWYAKKTGYTYYNFWDYPGTASKWFEETYAKPAITVELTHQLQSDWAKNKEALLEMISSVSTNGNFWE